MTKNCRWTTISTSLNLSEPLRIFIVRSDDKQCSFRFFSAVEKKTEINKQHWGVCKTHVAAVRINLIEVG